jgi:uncharacterized membrane-anchored protein YhcB (DUF1043 family)
MTKKTKTAELEIPEETAECSQQTAEEEETVDTASTESVAEETADTESAEQEPTEPEPAKPEPPAELTPGEKIEAYTRKEQVQREAQTELDNLEDALSAPKKEANGYKTLIADARAKVRRLNQCDVSGFLRWEKEQELPLIRKAEEAANALRHKPVEDLDVTEKCKERIAEHFTTCGSLADWLGKDFRDKKKGLGGEKTQELLRNAINKISGNVENAA